MKKIMYTLITGFLFLGLISEVKAEDKIYSLLKDAVVNNEWKSTSDSLSDSYVEIEIATKITDAEYKGTTANYITVFYCDGQKKCSLDDAVNQDTYISFEITKSGSKYVLKSQDAIIDIYNKLKENKQSYYYAIETEDFELLKTETISLNSLVVKEDTTLTSTGTKSTPYEIDIVGTITIPEKTNSIWEKTNNRLYFKISSSIKLKTKVSRYKIEPTSIASNIYAYNNAYSDTNNDSIMSDAEIPTYWALNKDIIYYIYVYDTDFYGKKITIKYVDDKPITIYTDVAKKEYENTYGEAYSTPEPGKSYGEVHGCAILGDNVTEWVKWIISLIRIFIPIGIVILTVIDFTKIVASGEDKEYKASIQKLIKRLAIGVVIVIVPALVALIIDMSGILTEYGITDDIFCSLF